MKQLDTVVMANPVIGAIISFATVGWSMMASITQFEQFITVTLGCALAVYASYKTWFKKDKSKK
jgi:hypothetical protein